MDGMTTTPAHAKSARRDHLWVLAAIAAFALFDVWESWTQVGNKSGFAHGTGWTLTVIVEAYACYALFAWFGAPGQRSRRFAMWSAFAVLVLSLIGQGSSVLAAQAVPPLWLKVFVKDLPVVVLALIAFLIHVRRLDRAEAEETERVRVEAAVEAQKVAAEHDDRAALQAQIEALTSELENAHLVASETGRRESEALMRADAAERKLAAKTAQAKRSKATREDDLTTEMRALTLLEQKPELSAAGMGAELGRQLGKSAATGRRLHSKLTAQGAPGGSLSERSSDQSGERS